MNVSWLTEPSPSYCGAQLASQRLGGGRLGQSQPKGLMDELKG
jgi:hypothetical protein